MSLARRRMASRQKVLPPEAAANSGPRLTDWEVRYLHWDPEGQPLREALLTLGNGHFATRGAGEEAHPGGPHYPGTYVAGGYDRARSEIAGRVVENEDLVNWPNWLPLTFRVPGEPWFELGNVEILEYEQRLNVYRGVLSRRVRFRDAAGREWLVQSDRIVHMGEPHTAAIGWTLTPIDWSGIVQIRSAIDGNVVNAGVPRYRDLNGRHLEIVDAGEVDGEAKGIFLVIRTLQSHIVMAQAARTRVYHGEEEASVERRTEREGAAVAELLTLACDAGKALRVEKIVAVFTSMDFAISEPGHQACKLIRRLPRFDALRASHERAWKHLWSRADLALSSVNHDTQLVLRLHIFHMLQTTSMHAIDRDVGIPARGLHGEAYRGHVFWDEIFIFPFLNLRIPELTRSLLMYRYRRLNEARNAASEAGFRGAMYPWQSGSDGREENQILHLNPKSGRWVPDATYMQRHVNAAIAYDVWQYYQATGDAAFLAFSGAEMLLEIARFWASIARYDPARGRYVIRGIVGPDEFHTRYPNSHRQGIDNNAYTNIMAAWTLRTALTALGSLVDDTRAELMETLGMGDEDVREWDTISRRMFVPFHGNRIISQFEGWDDLEELDWQALKARHGDIRRLDRILEAEGDDPNRYKAAKQADALMLFYLFSADEIRALFDHLGYEYDRDLIPRTVQYYLERTSHGSTLSGVVHAWLLARIDRKRSWHLFRNALASDIGDAQGGTTREGIHMGAMAGTVDLLQRCYTGLEMRDEVLWLNPRLPDELERLRFTVRYRGRWLGLSITQRELRVRFLKGEPFSARIGFEHCVYEIQQGEERAFTLRNT